MVSCSFVNGWYTGAARVDAHAGRIGGTISPEVITVHTTDTTAGTSAAIINSWHTTSGNGACAHFVIDRAGAITQLVPITRNGNHAGGTPKHGWFSADGGKTLIHPNTIAVGIEIENGGYLGRQQNGKWIHPDTRREIAASDVKVDSRGIGWHAVTDAQYNALEQLIGDLRKTIGPPRANLKVIPDGDYKTNMVTWAGVERPGVHGHASLDPVNKTDPGPFTMDWIRARY